MWKKLFRGVILSKKPESFVIFSKDVIEKLKNYQQLNDNDAESGGLLLGHIRGNHFEILDITTPYSNDLQKRFYFERRDIRHIKELDKKRKKSKYRICYLGEWHTHAEDYPIPSEVDLKEWHNIRAKRRYSLIFLIIGRKDFCINK